MSVKGIFMFLGMNNTRLERKILIILDSENGFLPTYLPQCTALCSDSCGHNSFHHRQLTCDLLQALKFPTLFLWHVVSFFTWRSWAKDEWKFRNNSTLQKRCDFKFQTFTLWLVFMKNKKSIGDNRREQSKLISNWSTTWYYKTFWNKNKKSGKSINF